MRVVFMGTPEFSVPILRALVENGYEVAGVFTQPDKPKGRGGKVQMTPVKEYALSQQIPVFQPLKIRKDGLDDLKSLAPDLCVTAAFGQILSQEVLDVPKIGTVNVHTSLLPRHRGAAPVQWTVWQGETVTGVTTMFTDAGIDYIGGELLSDLKAANYAGAFAKFSDLCDDFTAKAKSGDPYTKYNLPIKPLSFGYAIGALVAGFGIALIAVGSMKSKLKTVRFKAEANSYVRPGSMKVTFARDDFLYHTITSTPIPKNDSSSGGSSTHTSSSGATHGGGGGSF